MAHTNFMSSELRVTRASQGSSASALSTRASQGSSALALSTPTPGVRTRTSKSTNSPKIGKGKPGQHTSPELSKTNSRKIIPSVLHGIQDYMAILPQDLVKEMKQASRKAHWKAVAAEFMRKCAWRLRHFNKEELQKIAGNVLPSSISIISVEQAGEYLSEVQREIQSGISMSHESAARWFLYTSAGKEYLEYAKKTK